MNKNMNLNYNINEIINERKINLEKMEKLRKERNEKINKARSKFMSKFMKGKNNPRWKGGKADYTNHAIFKRMRIKVLQRSKGKCEICGEPAKIIHHIDGDKSNHSLNNLIALCYQCHEPFHCDNNGISIKGRPFKYERIYGMRLKDIAKLFRVTPSTIHYWIKNSDKKEWLKKKLKDYFKE